MFDINLIYFYHQFLRHFINGFLFFNAKIQNGYAMNATYGRMFSFKNQILN